MTIENRNEPSEGYQQQQISDEARMSSDASRDVQLSAGNVLDERIGIRQNAPEADHVVNNIVDVPDAGNAQQIEEQGDIPYGHNHQAILVIIEEEVRRLVDSRLPPTMHRLKILEISRRISEYYSSESICLMNIEQTNDELRSLVRGIRNYIANNANHEGTQPIADVGLRAYAKFREIISLLLDRQQHEEAERNLNKVSEHNEPKYPCSHELKVLAPLASITENRGMRSAPQDRIASNLNEENLGVNQTSQQTDLRSILNSPDNQQSQQQLSSASSPINFREEERQRDGGVIFTNNDESESALQNVICHDNVGQNNNHERGENEGMERMEGGECENDLQPIYEDTWILS